jgi:hypothetical protein
VYLGEKRGSRAGHALCHRQQERLVVLTLDLTLLDFALFFRGTLLGDAGR